MQFKHKAPVQGRRIEASHLLQNWDVDGEKTAMDVMFENSFSFVSQVSKAVCHGGWNTVQMDGWVAPNSSNMLSVVLDV